MSKEIFIKAFIKSIDVTNQKNYISVNLINKHLDINKIISKLEFNQIMVEAGLDSPFYYSNGLIGKMVVLSVRESYGYVVRLNYHYDIVSFTDNTRIVLFEKVL